jgi:hypothetical protein
MLVTAGKAEDRKQATAGEKLFRQFLIFSGPDSVHRFENCRQQCPVESQAHLN